MPKLQITILCDHNEIDFSALDKAFRNSPPVPAPVKVAPLATEPKAKPTMNEKLMAKEEAAKKVETENAEPESIVEDKEPLEATYDNVKNSVLELSKRKGRDAAKAALSKFGYEKVSAEMKESDYANVIAECQARIAA